MSRLLRLLPVLLVAACVGAPQAAPVPALRGAITEAGTAELAAAAARLVGAPSMSLAPNAFVEVPEISVEPRPARSLDGLADGRRRTPPVRLRLERDADGCLLRRVDTGASERLQLVRCTALSSPAPTGR